MRGVMMIDEVEQLLVHWGSQYKSKRLCVGIRCALDTDGQPRALGARSVGLEAAFSMQLDEVAEAVDAALCSLIQPVSLGGLGVKAGEELKKLVRVRYLTDPPLLVEQQMKRMRYKSDKTYRNKVHQLHVFVQSWLGKHKQLLK